MQIPYSNEKYVGRLVNELKAEGRITDEDVERARFERNERRNKRRNKKGYKK